MVRFCFSNPYVSCLQPGIHPLLSPIVPCITQIATEVPNTEVLLGSDSPTIHCYICFLKQICLRL